MPVSRKYKRVLRAMAGKRFPGEVETILKKTDRQYDAFRLLPTPLVGWILGFVFA